MALEIGQRVGDYEILALLGSGGMGRVYRVRNIISNRVEAMKVLLPDYAAEPELAARFMAEIRTLAGLEHPNIAQLRTAFQFENQIVMVMEFVEGATLENFIRQTPIASDQILEYSGQVLAALSYAHSRGVTHRDIKPANIMITAHGLAKLMDFGIAKSTNDLQLTRPGTTMGSVYYMSPEQVRGGTVDARSDIYSFGITLYELLTLRKPFQAETSYSVLNAHLNEAPVPLIQVNPAVPVALNDVVLRAIAKAPADRFQTADEFRNALRGLQRRPVAVAAATQLDQAAFASTLQAGHAPVPSPAAPPRAETHLEQAGFVPAPQAGYTPLPSSAASSRDATRLEQSGFASSPQGGYTPVPSPAAPPRAATQLEQAAFSPSPQAAFPPPSQSGYTPVAVAAAPPHKSQRGLWIGLGVAIALAALVGVAIVLPRVFVTHAGQHAQPVANTEPPAPSPSQPPATPQPSAKGAMQTPAMPPVKQAVVKTAVGQHPVQQPVLHVTANGSLNGTTPSQTPTNTTAPAPPPGPSPDAIRQSRNRYADLDARADAAKSGIESIRRQQQAQGYDMRGDILAAMNRLNSDMRSANQAINQNDLATAGQYMDSADKELATLENFLGR